LSDGYTRPCLSHLKWQVSQVIIPPSIQLLIPLLNNFVDLDAHDLITDKDNEKMTNFC